MALRGFHKTTRFFITAAIGSIALAGSVALAVPVDSTWFVHAVGRPQPVAEAREVIGHGQSLRYVQVDAKDGLTPVSAEVRAVPRTEQAAPLRGTGSIRADITRYNEERSVPRPQGRPNDDGRPPTAANYRN
jgi:hypothetical protein